MKPALSHPLANQIDNTEWFNQGKNDAWEGKPKQPPQHNCQAASLYELGYSEGQIEPNPTIKR